MQMDVRRREFLDGSHGGRWAGKRKIKGLERKMIPFQCNLSLCIQSGICFYLRAEIYLGCLLYLFSQDQPEEVLSLHRSCKRQLELGMQKL